MPPHEQTLERSRAHVRMEESNSGGAADGGVATRAHVRTGSGRPNAQRGPGTQLHLRCRIKPCTAVLRLGTRARSGAQIGEKQPQFAKIATSTAELANWPFCRTFITVRRN